MRFSIVIPVYNTEKYLAECLRSVLAQTFQDFELVVLDDGSTDKSAVIADAFAARHPEKVRVYHMPHKGLVLAIRSALSKTAGDFLWIIDADDFIRHDALAIVDRAIKTHHCDLVMLHHARLSADGRLSAVAPLFQNEHIIRTENKIDVYNIILDGGRAINNLWSKVMKRSLAEIERDFSEFAFLKKGTDFPQMLPVITNAGKIVYLDKPLYFYRQHPESITSRMKTGDFPSLRKNGCELEKYAVRWQLSEEDQKRVYLRHLKQIAAMAAHTGLPGNGMATKQKRAVFSEIARDDFFQNAYARADKSALPLKTRVLCGLLHKKQFRILLGVIAFYARIRGLSI